MTFRLLPLVVGGFMVYDVTRSVAYAFPAAIVGAVLLRRQMDRPAFRQLAAVVWLMAALISSVSIINGQIHATNSLFDQAAQKLRVPGPPPR